MSAAEPPKGVPRVKPPIPLYWWPLWMFLLALAIVVFYGILTPVWIGIRLAAWTSERASRWSRGRGADGGAGGRR